MDPPHPLGPAGSDMDGLWQEPGAGPLTQGASLVGVGVDPGVAEGLEAGLGDLRGEAGQKLAGGEPLPLADPPDRPVRVALLTIVEGHRGGTGSIPGARLRHRVA